MGSKHWSRIAWAYFLQHPTHESEASFLAGYKFQLNSSIADPLAIKTLDVLSMFGPVPALKQNQNI